MNISFAKCNTQNAHPAPAATSISTDATNMIHIYIHAWSSLWLNFIKIHRLNAKEWHINCYLCPLDEICKLWTLNRAVDNCLTHWGRVTHICIANLIIIGLDDGLSPGRRQAITWTNVGILLIGPLGTNFSEMLIGIQTFSFKQMHLKMSSAKWRPFCLGLNVLTNCWNVLWAASWISLRFFW